MALSIDTSELLGVLPVLPSTAAASVVRDGFKEMDSAGQTQMRRGMFMYEGVKMTSEMHRKRDRRFVLHTDPSTAPADAKVIYLVCDGEAVHDKWRAAEKAAGRSPAATRSQDGVPTDLHDPLLTSKGEADAAAAAKEAQKLPTPELNVSPLRRATQTGLAVFEHAVTGGVPVFAHELCREGWTGSDPSIFDSRKSRDALEKEFPKVAESEQLHSSRLPLSPRTHAEAHILT